VENSKTSGRAAFTCIKSKFLAAGIIGKCESKKDQGDQDGQNNVTWFPPSFLQ